MIYMNLPSFTSPFSIIAHKRTRSDELSNNPPSLPQISSDLILQVYTHVSLRRTDARPEGYGDNERLVRLGKAVLEATVTSMLFDKRPMLTVMDICIQRDRVLCSESIKKWADMYGMNRRLRCHPEVFSLLDTPEEAQTIFQAYLGGVYTERGFETAQKWITQLLWSQDDGIAPPPFIPPPKKIKNEESPSYIPPPIFFGSQPPPSPRQAPPPPVLTNPLSPAQPTLSFLPLFNQAASQRRVTVEYPAEFSGPSHAGRWSVRCVVNGISKGVGTGSSKQIAKEEAARQAYYAMGWT